MTDNTMTKEWQAIQWPKNDRQYNVQRLTDNDTYPIELEKSIPQIQIGLPHIWPTLVIDSTGRSRTKLYDKRDDFYFPIVNFPFICSNIPAAPGYGVYISQLIRCSRACGSYQDFLDRGLLLTRKLLNQWLLLVKLKSSLRKFYGRHPWLGDRKPHHKYFLLSA